jgi:glycosyltransferase involved in cell wall biosynthesis
MAQARPRHLFHVFPTFAVGGAQMRFTRIAAALGARCRHTVLGLSGDYGCRRLVDADLDVRYHDMAIDPRRGLANLPLIRRTLRRLRPDLLVSYNFGSIEWPLANVLRPIAPHVHFEDGFGPEEAERQLPRRVWARRVALARSRAVVVPSLTLQRIATEVWRLPAARVRYVPNGIDIAPFAGPGEPGLLPDGALLAAVPVVGTVAALRPEKNLGRLLRAFAQAREAVPAARLLIVGDGPARAGLQAEAAALGIAEAVTFAGYIADPGRVLPLLDVFALSSDTEQMPLSVLEAMAAALPVAGVDVGDVRTMVAEANRRFVVARGDEAGLAQAIATLLADPDLARCLGAGNRAAVVERFPPDRMFRTYEALLLGQTG